MKLFFSIIIWAPLFSMAQNLVPNPCFGNYPENRKWHTFAYHAEDWFTLNKSTPDLFFSKNTNAYKVPLNYMGEENPVCGFAYAGAFLISSNHRKQFNTMTEYIATKLTHPLEKDTLYCISFYTRLADNCLYATNGMDVLFARKLKKNKYSRYMNLNFKYQPQIRNIGNGVIENSEWRKVCSVYQAKGGEKYIAIGNFNRIEDIQIKELDRKIKNPTSSFYCAYYYFDNISLGKISSPDECICTIKDTSHIMQVNADTILNIDKIFSKDEAMILNNVFFKTDKWELLPESFSQLDEITEYLISNPQLYIEISGHTDNTGNEQNNIQLSEARAQSVATYLITNGIQSTRIIVKGYGSSKPVDSNETDAGRAKNRRVEIFLFENN
jgi:OmpA-OmpF porin, OOP family